MTIENSVRYPRDVRSLADLARDMRLATELRIDWHKCAWRLAWLEGDERWRVLRWPEALAIVEAAGLLEVPKPTTVQAVACARCERVRALRAEALRHGKRVLP